ncbi:MAG: phenylalanine--tRNA ligase subunit beta [Elainellaceae cyanobacterium]
MRISLEWLQEFVEVAMTPVELSDLLTMAGFEVEDIEDRRSWADGVVIGYVSDCQPHPNADKLRVCTVDIGQSEASTIVCGAANVKSGIFVPVAAVGTYLPKIDIKISPRKLRGVKSQGMICSQSELGLEKDSEGIYIFSEVDRSDTSSLGQSAEQPKDQPGFTPGEDARPYLGLDDVVLDVTSTANRADALSMIGIAREVAALTGSPLSLPECPEVDLPSSPQLTITVQEPQACPTYIGTTVGGVTLGPSPKWLQRRLQAAGVRPINTIVDVTNYVLLEWGQPLHAFDYDRLVAYAGGDGLTIGVRFAQSGETLKTLDGQARKLQPQALLITAGDRPVALAGVMGGEDTEVHEGTTAVMLEAALFGSVAIRRSARSQSLRTEASARYERGVNQAEVRRAARRALDLIQTLAGGTLQQQAVADTVADTVRTVELRQARVNQVLGPVVLTDESLGALSAEEIERILMALGCRLEARPGCEVGSSVWQVAIPPYRYRDLEREIDLIEEVARLYGYNRFATTLPGKSEAGYLSPRHAATQRVTAALRAEGLTELVHYSLVKPEDDRQIKLANPLYAEYSALRMELFSALLDAFQYNLEQGSGALNGFELGRVFWQEGGERHEQDLIAGVLGGDPKQGRWTQGGRDRPMDWFEAKGVLESVFRQLGVAVESRAYADHPWLHPGRTASLWLGEEQLGLFGQLHPQVRQQRDLPEAVYLFRLDLEVLLAHITQEGADVPRFTPYSTYPAADRDIAFYAPLNLPLSKIGETIQAAGAPLLSSVELFDEYRGEGVPEGQRSLALRLVYRTAERTLTDEDVDPVHQKVRDALVEDLGVTPRS